MAFASDSTTAPARPLLPLLPFVFRPAPPVDDPRSAEELLEEIRRTIEGQMPPEPLLPAPAPLPSLTAALSRRRAIFGGLAIAAAPVATLPAVASTAPIVTPEAAALLREFHDVAGRYNAAGERLDKAMTATARVSEPEALFARGQDFWVLGCIPPQQHWTMRRYTYGTDDLIAQLRALPAGDGDRSRSDRRDEIVGTWDRWHEDKRAAENASGETAASDHYRAVGAEHDLFVLRLVHLKTADPDVMRIKAALVLNAWRDVDRFDNVVRRVAEDSEYIEDSLSISLMRDLMGQLGTTHRVAA